MDILLVNLTLSTSVNSSSHLNLIDGDFKFINKFPNCSIQCLSLLYIVILSVGWQY